MNGRRAFIPASMIAIIALVISMTTGASPGPTDNAENFELHLIGPGWNLVSFPVVNENTTIGSVFTGLTYYENYYFYYWNPPYGPYGVDLDDTSLLEDNRGYWVWINQDKTITTGYPQGPAGPRGYGMATFVVAAHDSLDNENADFVCNGIDDQVEINAAIGNLPAIGGSIYLREGTYVVSDNIIISKSNVALIGAGASTVLKIKDNKNASMYVIGASNKVNLLIRDLHMDGNKANQTAGYMYGIYFNGVEDSKIVDCWLENLPYSGIRFYYSNNNAVTGNTCQGNGEDGIYLGVANNNNNAVTGNTCQGNDRHGIYLYQWCDNNTISGNTCQGNGEDGIYLGYLSNNAVTGNTCQGNGSSGIHLFNVSNNNAVTGNTCQGNGSSGIYLQSHCKNNTITGNTCKGNIYYGIYLKYKSENNTVGANTCQGNGDRGIVLDSSSNNTVTGNTCVGNYYGIVLDSSSNNTVTGNTCKGNDVTGIWLKSYSNNNTVTGNTSQGNGGRGIWLDYSDNSTVTGNTCGGNDGHGILLFSSSNNTVSSNIFQRNDFGISLGTSSENNTITGNTCQGNDGHGIYLSSSINNNTVSINTVIGNNQVGGNYDGIHIDGNSDYNNIQGNTVRRGTGGNQQRYGIRIDQADCNGNLVINNDLYQAGATADNFDAGTGTIFRNNRLTTGWAPGYG